MRAAVKPGFMALSKQFEGEVATTYCDKDGRITIGVGNLEDDDSGVPPATYLALPFIRRSDGQTAARAEKAAEWLMMHTHRAELAVGGWKAAAKLAKLILAPVDVETLVLSKLAEDDAYLAERFAAYEQWNCDAQLGTLSLSWADGPAFKFPRFEAAVRALDFATAAIECHMDDSHNPGLKPRNAADHVLFQNAARAIAQGLDPDILHYPGALEDDDPTSVDVDTSELEPVPAEVPDVPCAGAEPPEAA